MRALFEDKYNGTAQPLFTIDQVGLPQNTNKRDVWFSVTKTSGLTAVKITAHRTRADAVAGATIIAQFDGNIGDASPWVFVDNAGNAPDMTGLEIQVTETLVLGTTVATIWGYTAEPDLVVADNIVTTLQAYTGTGQALADFTNRNIYVGPAAAAEESPFIAVRTVGQEPGDGFGTKTLGTKTYILELENGVNQLDEGSSKGPIQETWRQAREHQAAIETILFDEKRTLEGELLLLMARGGDPPDAFENDELDQRATTEIGAEFHALWQDIEYPR